MIPRDRWLRLCANGMALTVLAIGCRSDSTSPYDNLPEGAVEARINNIEFRVRTGVYVTHSRGVLSISAIDDTQRSIQLALLAPDVPATVEVGPSGTGSAITGYRQLVWRSNVTGGSGRVTFTKVTFNQSVGTFTFTAAPVPGTATTGTQTVTGAFNVTYVR